MNYKLTQNRVLLMTPTGKIWHLVQLNGVPQKYNHETFLDFLKRKK